MNLIPSGMSRRHFMQHMAASAATIPAIQFILLSVADGYGVFPTTIWEAIAAVGTFRLWLPDDGQQR